MADTQRALRTLSQQFPFAGSSAEALATRLWTGPLIGENSLFGPHPEAKSEDSQEVRKVLGFSPAPSIRFDVHLRRLNEHQFVARFEQPDRAVPYLSGELLWSMQEGEGGAIFDEQINTPVALEHAQPLTGPKPSLRRFIFFKVGHRKVMEGTMKNLAALLTS